MRKSLLVALLWSASGVSCSFIDLEGLQRGLSDGAGDENGGGGGGLISPDGGMAVGGAGGDPGTGNRGGDGDGGTPATPLGGRGGGGASNDGGSVATPSGGDSTGAGTGGMTAGGAAGRTSAPDGGTGGEAAGAGGVGGTAAGAAGIGGAAAGTGGVGGSPAGGTGGSAGAGGSGGVAAEIVAVLAAPGGGIIIDGDLGEWGTQDAVTLGPEQYVPVDVMAALPTDSSDLSTVFLLRWTADTLYLGVTVTDDVHLNDTAANALWQEDSLQLALDLPSVTTTSNYDREFGWALSDGALLLDYRWLPTGSAAVAFSYQIVRGAGVTVYEIGIPATEIGVAELAPSVVISGSIAVNEIDDAVDGRLGWLELTPGLVSATKTPAEFLTFALQ